ncbi:hypothetical protein D3C72_1637430 [compost metagenome]
MQHFLEGRQHAQGQHIHFQQAHGIQVVLVPLDDGAVLHAGVLDRHHARQWSARQHKAADMLRQVARKVAQGLHQLYQLAHGQVIGLQASLLQRFAAQQFGVPLRMVAGQQVDLLRCKPQGLGHVTDRGFSPVADDHRRQACAVQAVFLVQVLDDFFAPRVFEIHVDIGRLVAFPADEALKQHRAFDGVYLGHAQAIADG